MLQNKKLLLFDLDETIYDHKYASYCGLMAVAQRFQQWRTVDITNLENEYFHDLHSTHLNVIDGKISEEDSHSNRFNMLAQKNHLKFTPSEILMMIEIYNDVSKNSRRAIPEAPETIQQLYETGFKIAIITNGKSQGQRNKLKICGIENYIHHIIISEEIGFRKPSKEIFSIALEQAKTKEIDAVMIGDSLDSDIKGAINAGIDSIWVKHRKQLAGATFKGPTVTHIKELLN